MVSPTSHAWLPVALLTTPVLAALPALVAPRGARRALWVGSSALSLALAGWLAQVVVTAGSIRALGGELLADGLGALMSLLIAFLALVCSIYALGYMPGQHPREPARRERLERRLPLFTALFLVLEFTLLWVVLTNNVVLLWVALEATTLASALLVSFYWDTRALEAGYKYLLLLTVGITSAFFGCVLLFAAAAPHLGTESALLLSNLRLVADRIPAHSAAFATALLLLGFGTKAGLAPFHPWVADAHAEAPAPMSAFLSSVIIKVPFVGILRVWSVFGPREPALGEALLWLGGFTMVVGALLAVAQDDLKRLHAYSSVSQVGYIAVALGLGPPVGYYVAAFFLVSHALAKALLFLATGAVVHAASEIRSLRALGGLRDRMPVTATCALVGALSLAGLPPLAGFAAKAGVLFAAAEGRAWWTLAVAAGASLFTMAYMTGMLQHVFRGPAPAGGPALEEVHEVPATMLAGMGMLAVALIVLGLAPFLLDPLLRRVAAM
jgi:hydrogenase-4 component F